MKLFFNIAAPFTALFFIWPVPLQAQTPAAATGTIRHFENFTSKYVAPRTVDVWLPPGYDSTRKYAVLYMHDGGSLYDSSITWNHQEWGVDETVSQLIKEKKINNCIVVGIWNTGETRHNEYLPQQPFEMLSPAEKDTLFAARRIWGQPVFVKHDIRSDNYLKFIVQELKPFIDKNFSTSGSRANTFIAGSSMGGLISLYAICEYPGVFGGAACLSTHWPGIFRKENNPFPAVMLRYLEANLPSPAGHRIYMDIGTATLDSLYAPYQEAVNKLMRERGYTSGNWASLVYPGADHSERAWNKRLATPLIFLLRKNHYPE